jgi:hypothetical protein
MKRQQDLLWVFSYSQKTPSFSQKILKLLDHFLSQINKIVRRLGTLLPSKMRQQKTKSFVRFKWLKMQYMHRKQKN